MSLHDINRIHRRQQRNRGVNEEKNITCLRIWDADRGQERLCRFRLRGVSNGLAGTILFVYVISF